MAALDGDAGWLGPDRHRWAYQIGSLEERDVDRLINPAQRVRAESPHSDLERAIRIGCGGNRLRGEDLSAIGGRHDARGSVHVQSHVAARRACRRAAMQPDADRDRPVTGLRIDPQAALDGDRRARRGGRGFEDGEELISDCFHLAPAVLADRLPDRGADVLEKVGVAQPEPLQMPGRVLDVREEKREVTASRTWSVLAPYTQPTFDRGRPMRRYRLPPLPWDQVVFWAILIAVAVWATLTSGAVGS